MQMQSGYLKCLDGSEMQDDLDEPSRFALGLTALRQPDGNFDCAMQTVNQGIPIEIVIMQLRAFLKQMEHNYFSSFEKGTE